MGHASPIVRQVRWGRKPDGVCLVVGSCARGFPPASNTTGDVILTNSHSQPPAAAASGGGGGSSSEAAAVHNTQFFWQAPAVWLLLRAARSSPLWPRCLLGAVASASPAVLHALQGGLPSWQRPQRSDHLPVHLPRC
jgi:hypothetical protein